jgi:RNA polymerase sigma-70 factor, ECF subfamily
LGSSPIHEGNQPTFHYLKSIRRRPTSLCAEGMPQLQSPGANLKKSLTLSSKGITMAAIRQPANGVYPFRTEQRLIKRGPMSTHQPIDSPNSTAFFEAYYGRIYRYVASLVHDPGEAEDLTQETFLRAYRERDSLREQGALVAWLYRIATHVALDRLRQRTRRAPKESDADVAELELPDPDAPSLQQSIEQNEMSACVQKYIADLPDSYRAVILLHDLHGLTGTQIAQALDLPLATVKIRLHRARRRLQSTLQAHCSFSFDERNVLVCESKA